MTYIYIGKIVNTHGIKGEVRLISNFRYKNKVFVKNMNIYIGKDKIKEVIISYRTHKNFDMIVMDGYNNINDVLKCKGSNVYINKDDLKLDANEYLDEDLIGLDVIIGNDNVGVIKKVEYQFKQPLFVVKTIKNDCLIPYVSDIIEEVNLSYRYIKFKDIKGLI